jgi:hypothetical protein
MKERQDSENVARFNPIEQDIPRARNPDFEDVFLRNVTPSPRIAAEKLGDK